MPSHRAGRDLVQNNKTQKLCLHFCAPSVCFVFRRVYKKEKILFCICCIVSGIDWGVPFDTVIVQHRYDEILQLA